MPYTLKYRRARIIFKEDPREGACVVCGPIEKKRNNQLHHWLFYFPTSAVRENPILGLINTVETCRPHHDLANTLRHFTEIKKLKDADILISTMPEQVRKRFIRIIKHFYKEWGK